MNVGYVHTFEVPENNIDKGRLKVSVVNEENVPIKGAAVRLSYTGNPDNIIGESGTDGDGISIFNDLRTPPIEYSMEPGNRQPFSEYDIAVSAPGFDNVNISGSDMFSGELSIQNVKMSARDNSQNNIVIPVNTLYGDYPPKIDEEEIKPMGQSGEIVLDRVVVPEIVVVSREEEKSTLTESDNEMDERAVEAVKAAINKAKICKKPIAGYDNEKKQAYVEYANGERKYAE